METKEKCEQIIQVFNGKTLQGSKDALLVKFADGGQKKRSIYRSENRIWREGQEVCYPRDTIFKVIMRTIIVRN